MAAAHRMSDRALAGRSIDEDERRSRPSGRTRAQRACYAKTSKAESPGRLVEVPLRRTRTSRERAVGTSSRSTGRSGGWGRFGPVAAGERVWLFHIVTPFRHISTNIEQSQRIWPQASHGPEMLPAVHG